MTHLETLATDWSNNNYGMTFQNRDVIKQAFLAGAQARQQEIDELVAALEDIVAAYKRGCVDYKGCECWWQIALNALKKHGSAKDE